MDRRQRAWLPLLIAVVIASGCLTPGTDHRSEPAPEAERAPRASEMAPAPSASVAPGRLPSNPLPRGGVASLPSFQAEVMDFQRGDAALRLLRAENTADEVVVPPGAEYVIVRLGLTGIAPKFLVSCRRFRVIGTARIAYFYASPHPPAPALERRALTEGERTEGWCVYSVRADERDLILMVTESKRLARERRYLALDQGAALAPAALPAPTSSEEGGESPLAAARPGQEVHTQDWSVTAVEILRGGAARRLVEAANRHNPPPAEGLEFVAVKLRARYRGRTEHPELISPSQFRTIDSDGVPYEIPIVIDVRPRLSRLLLPGGESTGWVVLQVDPGDSRAVLRFQPFPPDRQSRYFALVESAGPEGGASRVGGH